MRVMVSIPLLLFEFLVISAHVLPKSELENPARDIYEVQEAGKPGTTFFAPKPEKPTLREIVYYHVVERPYDGVKVEKQSEPLEIGMDESTRSFTNGHGYQFAEIEPEPHKSPELDPEDVNEEENDKEENDEDEEALEENFEMTTGRELINREEDTEMPKTTTTTPSEEKKIQQRQFLFDRLRERYNASFKKSSTTERPEIASSTEKTVDVTPTSTEKDAITNSTEKVETITTSTVAMTASTPAVRVRRSVNYEIPMAPTLPTIDYDKYPGLQVFSDPVYETDPEEETNQDNLRAMKFKINDIFATMKPYDGHEIATHTAEIKVRTYGMNLSDDQGTVWNNMWRPINYHVGEPVKFYEVNENQISTMTPIAEEVTTEATTTDPKDLEDIVVDKNESTTKDKQDIYVDVKKEKKDKPKFEKSEESTDKEDIYVDVKKEKIDKPKTEKLEDIKQVEPSKELEEEKEINNVAAKSSIPKKIPRKEKPTQDKDSDLYELLIKSDKFWKWLAQWTSNYMEILYDRVKNMIKEEVAKEMKKLDKAHDKHLNKTKDESKPVITHIEKNKEPVIKNNTLIIDGKEIPITNTSNLEGNVTKDLLKHKDRHEKPNHNKLNESILENNKTINNKVTTPNATKNEENYNNVKAHNIYGSATGNDQVTNVFIFYPGTDTEKIINSIKPILGSNISAISTDKKDKDNEEKGTTTQKPIETTLSSKEPDNITTPKPVKDDKTNKTEENLPVDNKNTTKLEASKESDTPNTNSKDQVTEKNKDATETVTENSIITTTIETPKTTESPSTVENTEKSKTSTTPTSDIKSDTSTEKSTEKSIDNNTTSLPTDTSSEKPLATFSASTDATTKNSTGSSTADSANSTTIASTIGASTIDSVKSTTLASTTEPSIDPVNSTTLATTVADTTTNKSS